MFCQKCGNQLNEGVAFCPKCGEKKDTASGIRAQGTNGNSTNITKPKKRIPTLLMCIGVIMYGLYAWAISFFEFEYGGIFFVPCLIGVVEFICTIAYKKAVFVSSIIQAAAITFCLVYFFSGFDGIVITFDYFNLFLIFLPIAACALLLIGGIMFKKENAMNELSGGVQ